MGISTHSNSSFSVFSAKNFPFPWRTYTFLTSQSLCDGMFVGV